MDLVLNNLQRLICHKTHQTKLYGVDFGVMVIIIGNGHGDQVQFLDEAVCISHSVNDLRKGIQPTILLPAMSQ